jgi:hypothetical protein
MVSPADEAEISALNSLGLSLHVDPTSTPEYKQAEGEGLALLASNSPSSETGEAGIEFNDTLPELTSTNTTPSPTSSSDEFPTPRNENDVLRKENAVLKKTMIALSDDKRRLEAEVAQLNNELDNYRRYGQLLVKAKEELTRLRALMSPFGKNATQLEAMGEYIRNMGKTMRESLNGRKSPDPPSSPSQRQTPPSTSPTPTRPGSRSSTPPQSTPPQSPFNFNLFPPPR